MQRFVSSKIGFVGASVSRHARCAYLPGGLRRLLSSKIGFVGASVSRHARCAYLPRGLAEICEFQDWVCWSKREPARAVRVPPPGACRDCRVPRLALLEQACAGTRGARTSPGGLRRLSSSKIGFVVASVRQQTRVDYQKIVHPPRRTPCHAGGRAHAPSNKEKCALQVRAPKTAS